MCIGQGLNQDLQTGCPELTKKNCKILGESYFRVKVLTLISHSDNLVNLAKNTLMQKC